MIAAAMLAAALLEPTAAPRFEQISCPQPPPSPRARCGILRVPENRQAPGGRTIALNMIVLPAAKAPARLPPLFDFDGGPGLPATKNAEFYATNGISRDRDVVMLDQRGTGASNGLHCAELAAVPPTSPMLPVPAVRTCLDALRKKADLRFYGTLDAVEDIEAVRRALGYGKIDLFGLSYGTTVALRYMQRHPSSVRVAVLMGTAPPSTRPPREHATAGARALDLTLDDCAADPACNARYPDLRADLARALQRLAAPASPLPPELFLEWLRSLLYSPMTRASVPGIIVRASTGDVAPMLALKPQIGGPAIADGMFLAVTCGESFPLMNFAAAVAKARATPFGDYRLRRQRAACRGWPRVRLDPHHLELPDAAIPTLLISGNMDPVTPPALAEVVTRRMRSATHVVIAKGGHTPDGLSGLETCLVPLIVAFLDHGDASRLDLSCVARMTAPPYATN